VSRRRRKAKSKAWNAIERTGIKANIHFRIDTGVIARFDEIKDEISVGWFEATVSDVVRLLIHVGLEHVDIKAVCAEILSKRPCRSAR